MFFTDNYLAGLSDRELFRLHEEFVDLRLHMWRIGALIESFDPWGLGIIRKYLERNQLEVTPEDITILTGPRKLSFNQQELLERLQLALRYKKGIDIKLDIMRHTKNYYWLLNSWAVVSHLNEKYFWHQIRQHIKLSPAILRQRIREIKNYQIQVSNKMHQLTKKYHLPRELRLIFSFFSQMADWRDERKEQIHRVNSTADVFLEEFSRRTGIEKKYLCYLDAYEMKSIAYLKGLEKQLMKRLNGSLYYTYGEKGIRWMAGRSAQRLYRLLELRLRKGCEVEGIVANKGHAVGHVKILVTRADFQKMKTGDILVTQMTRPEYFPVLHKAAAFVTDEGGVTCHAVIISRELGIPCIIGTQVATSVLKDCDLVEVDANKGVVRRIK